MRKFLMRAPGSHYAYTARQNAEWRDHVLRTELTASLISWLDVQSVIDPAAGDGSIVAAAHKRNPIHRLTVGEISVPNRDRMAAMCVAGELPSETRVVLGDATTTLIEASDRFDLVVLTEFLEHLTNPGEMLGLARRKADWLVASSPLWDDSRGDDLNPEHLWQFDESGYRELLVENGWDPRLVLPVKFTGGFYDFQIWVAR